MRTRLAVLAVAGALTLAACGGSDSDGSAGSAGSSAGESASESATTSPSSSESSSTPDSSSSISGSADDVLHDAVEASLDASSFDVDATTQLTIGPDGSSQQTQLMLDVAGPVDYDQAIADTTLRIEKDGQQSQARIVSDGSTLWVSVEGSQAPAFPDGKTWVSGDASRLAESSSFGPTGTIGPVIVLSGAEGATKAGTGEKDGVAATEYTFTVPYDEAVTAAGSNADAFTNAFSLTGDASSADLDVDVWVGDDDDIVRELVLTVDTDVPVTGGVQLTLSGVNQDVDAPTPPDAADVATGPEAEALLDQLVTS